MPTDKVYLTEWRLGFTGTRSGMTEKQKFTLAELLDHNSPRTDILEPPDDSFNIMHWFHGGAIGSDEESDNLVTDIFTKTETRLHILITPASEARWRFWNSVKAVERVTRTLFPPEDPLVRNRKMVKDITHLYAAPAERDEVRRSGTWATIRYARVAGIGLTIIRPDGTVKIG